MREAGRRLAVILHELAALVAPGVTTGDLEEHARRRLQELETESAFLGYTAGGARPPFPSVFCASINDELIHAPSLPSRTLKNGDIIGLDFGLRYPQSKITNYQLPITPHYADMAVTVAVGNIPPRVQTLLTVTREALDRAIAVVQPGAHLKDVARAIERHIESNGFSVARDYVGHGIGRALHEPPEVPNFVGREFPDVILKPGMTLAIEPMVIMGSPWLIHGPDGWTVKTKDGSFAAHFEHTIAVTETGAEVLTRL